MRAAAGGSLLLSPICSPVRRSSLETTLVAVLYRLKLTRWADFDELRMKKICTAGTPMHLEDAAAIANCVYPGYDNHNCF
jgi:hypothetical protein